MKHLKFFLPAVIIASSFGSFQGMAKAQSAQSIIDQTNDISGSIYRQNENLMNNANRQAAQHKNNLRSLCWQGYGWACGEYSRVLAEEGARLDRAIQSQQERNQYRSY